MTEKEKKIIMDSSQFETVRVTLKNGRVIEGTNELYESELDNDDMDEPVADMIVCKRIGDSIFITLDEIEKVEMI